MEPKKFRFGDPELDGLLESLHKSIKKNKYEDESAVDLLKRMRRETTHCAGA